MSQSGSGRETTFHEGPLVVFTALAVAAAGIGASTIVLAAGGSGAWSPSPGEAAAVAGLLALGIAFSTVHLGKPLRAVGALRGLGRSALTHEILVVGATVVAAGLVVVVPRGHPVSLVSGALVPVLSVGVLLTLGMVYRLPTQLAWRGLAVVQPLVLGLVFGLALHAAWGAESRPTAIPDTLLLVGLLDVLFAGARGVGLETAKWIGAPRYPAIFRRRAALLGSRVLLVDLLPPLAFLSGWMALMVLFLCAGVFLDRIAFYGLAVQQTTEAEIGGVERVLEGISDP